jgi:hypothetical protein
LSWFALWLGLELGVTFGGGVALYDPPRIVQPDPVYHQTLGARAWLFDVAYFGGGVTVREWRNIEDLFFWPWGLESRAEAGLAWGIAELNIAYVCNHPVMPLAPAVASSVDWEASYWQATLRLGGIIGGKSCRR